MTLTQRGLFVFLLLLRRRTELMEVVAGHGYDNLMLEFYIRNNICYTDEPLATKLSTDGRCANDSE